MQLKTLARVLLVVVAAAASAAAQSVEVPAHAPTSINRNYGKLPLTFEANRGQTDPQVKFVSRGPGYNAFLTSDGMVLSLHASQVTTGQSTPQATPASSSKVTALRFRLVGASSKPTVVGENPQSGRANYFIGSDPSQWHTNVPVYSQVRYKNLYPGIDLLYYGNQRQLEYDFEVLPGADLRRIQFTVQ